ncbi:MAG: xylulokinase, partial [Enterocloster clostridioformis]|nr:xylulokinase [Enterocloster clostridioformis]
MRYLIGIDIGTSATKTILMDEEGNVAAQAVRDYPLYQPDNGWAEQAPEDWQQAALETLKQVVEQSGVNRDDIQGIGLSGQMHGLVMLDEAGNPIRRSIIWCDQRSGQQVD